MNYGYLIKGCKPDHFELHNSIKFSFTNIWGLCLNFVDCKSFLESNPPDILALCETNLDGSRGYFPLIQKDSSTHMHGLGWNSADSYLCFGLALLQSVSYFIFLCRSPSLSLCTVFDSISSNIDEVLSINPSANVFVFEDINVQHKDWLTYSGGTDRLGELSFQIILPRWLTLLLGSRTVILIVLLFWIYFFLLSLVFVLQ